MIRKRVAIKKCIPILLIHSQINNGLSLNPYVNKIMPTQKINADRIDHPNNREHRIHSPKKPRGLNPL